MLAPLTPPIRNKNSCVVKVILDPEASIGRVARTVTVEIFRIIILGWYFVFPWLFTSIVTIAPLFITSLVLVMVGVYMFRNIVHLDFTDIKITLPSFLTIVLMPLSYNIVIGLSLVLSLMSLCTLSKISTKKYPLSFGL